MKTIQELREEKLELKYRLDLSEAALQVFGKFRGEMGLMDDKIAATEDYKACKKQFEQDFAAYRAFNAKYAKLLRRDEENELTLHGLKTRDWPDIHQDHKSIKDGVKYVLVLDEHNATVSMPFDEAKKRNLI